MKSGPVPLIVLLLFATVCFAQQETDYRIYLSNGTISPAAKLDEQELVRFNTRRSTEPVMRVMQFEVIPTEKDRSILLQAGIELLEYLPNKAYTVMIRGGLSANTLRQAHVRAMIQLQPEQKMQPQLVNGQYPPWSVVVPGSVDCWISFPKSFNATQVRSVLAGMNITVLDDRYKSYRILAVRVPSGRLKELASSDYIEYVQAIPRQDEPVNDNSRGNSRANVLQDPSGRNLDGAGVVIGVGDNADPLQHIDLAERVINRSPQVGGAHGMHVMGTTAGAGIIMEQQRGIAPAATIIAQAFSNIIALAPVYVADNNMVITNNSYGNVVNDCASFGIYDLYSRITDQQAFEMPHLQHVFAAGNSGNYNCAGYPAGFSNVLGAYQTAKNVICVGNGGTTYALNTNSSRGPVRDGRIKPEIVAQGTSVLSTGPGNSYIYQTGTSMSAPAVSGGLALLYQRYRQLHAGADPLNGLMKAILLNGADDKGNPGPDYRFGFGWMNLLRSVGILERQNYFTSSVTNGSTQTHTLNIPSGTSPAVLKVMLYWNDSAAAVFAAHALVNDLDLEVSDPASAVILPQLLDTTKANVNNNATTGADHINNIEQVVITNPQPGNYTFTVKGTNIPAGGSHSYFLVFDTVSVSARLTYPSGGERLVPSEGIYIVWDADGNPSQTFALEFSSDNGVSWTPIQSGIPAGSRILAWTIPSVTTDQARIKLIHTGTGIESLSEPFTILGSPVLSLSATQCAGYADLSWTAVAGATDYEVMMLKGSSMKPVTIVNATNYVVSGLNPDTTYYFSVRARINGKIGRRATAISRKPDSGTCVGTISDNDLRMEAIVLPAGTGRLYTSTALPASAVIRVRIKNLDDVATAGNAVISYRINGGSWITENLVNPAIGAGAVKLFSFTTTANLALVGLYDIEVAVSQPGDPVLSNDTLKTRYRQLDNAPIDLTTDYLEGFEAMPAVEYIGAKTGLEGADRYDFRTNTEYGRLRSYVNTGIAIGNRALTIDSRTYNGLGSSDSIIGTYNLSGYDATTDDIRLDFLFKHHGQFDYPSNRCWVRGSDIDNWIEIYDLAANQADVGVFKRSASLELSRALNNAGQQFSSSTQIRWGQFGQYITADQVEASGYTFDQVHLYVANNDLQMLMINSPVLSSCGLGNTETVQVIVRNSSTSVINSIPVYYQIDGGIVVSDVIPSIAPNQSLVYSFAVTTDLSVPGLHDITVWTGLGSDSYNLNDTLRMSFHNSPVISVFPYLQDFEVNDGDWYPAGNKSSWEYGTPSSPNLSRAASGVKAWKTGLTGHYNDGEFSYLYSPCFDLGAMSNPTLSFSVALDIEDCGAGLCDAAYVEYSYDGIIWERLGSAGTGTNFYNRVYDGEGVWSVENYTRWHVATSAIPTTGDMSRVRLRFVMLSDPFVARDGIAIDDIHIYDGVFGIYSAAGAESPDITVGSVNGSGWINFVTGGQLVASVNPQGQDLGSTVAKAYINAGAVRWNGLQYYHDRDITIKPSNISLAGPAKVRFYFTDTETEALINAVGCAGCSKPAMAYELGVSWFSAADDNIENGTLADNTGGLWTYFTPSEVKIVPFDIGYYAEFDVAGFSEFWLNNGGTNQNQVLPVRLVSFTAMKINNGLDVQLDWVSASEENVLKYVIETARSNEGFDRNDYSVIGEVTAIGTTATELKYTFTDRELNKSGVRYYRLRIVDRDGRVRYSSVRPVLFRNEISWNVYPNPSGGLFNLVYQANDNDGVSVRVHDLQGKLVYDVRSRATGFVQKYELDLTTGRFAPGIYLCEITAGDVKKSFRIYKR
ncbi:MAG: S8 family serine peptidase [Chitinophagaceae bacterium]